MAIVEFLTAKSTASGKSKSSRPSDQPGDQTPVDLLLNLAKTRSGRRAAEEEKRQFRLQQYREVEEQRRAASGSSKGNKDGMTSPWGYQAPQMPGLDVQQPFAANGMRKVPRPLAAPSKRGDSSSKEMDDAWNMAFNMDPASGGMVQPDFSAASLGSSSSRPNSAPFGNGHLQPQQHQQHQHQQQQQQQLSPHQAMHNPLQFPSSSTSNNFGQMTMPNMQHQTSLSPDDIFNLANVNQDSNQQNGGQMDSMQQLFGNAMMDQFDFSDLGLGSGVQNNSVEASFNPFALAQAEEG